MRIERHLGAVLATLLLIALAAALVWAATNTPPMPSILLSGGGVLQVKAVTYGTNHVVGSSWGKLYLKLPQMLQRILSPVQRAHWPLFQSTSSKPELWVWFESSTNWTGAGSLHAQIADRSGFLSGEEIYESSMGNLHYFQFPAWPRRGDAMEIHIYSRSGEQSTAYGAVTIENPTRGNFPQWQPQSLPVTKTNGDLEVTLLSFATGCGSGSETVFSNGKNRIVHRPRTNMVENHSAMLVRAIEPARPSSRWAVASICATDATGNSINNSGMSWRDGSEPYTTDVTFSPGLWPDEPAWKLALELKRTAGFASNEVFTFKNVPIPMLNESNHLSWATNYNGLWVSLAHVVHRPPLTNHSYSGRDLSVIGLTNSAPPKGWHVDKVAIVADGADVEHLGWSSSGAEREYHVRGFPPGAKTMDITMAVHQSRTVEFMVKPEVARIGQKRESR